MDKKLNKRVEIYLSSFKSHIKDLILKQDLEKSIATNLIESVYNYERLEFTKEDVSKRKRIKNSIPGLNRCNAKRANCEQCTRKQKEGYTFCGTHVKGTPHGVITSNEGFDEKIIKWEVYAEDINGIVYYIDKCNNIYKTEDILNNKQNPEIIAKCEKLDNGKYTIKTISLL
jgi:hypothetical protein